MPPATSTDPATVHALLAAQRTIATDPSLAGLPGGIVDAACSLTGAPGGHFVTLGAGGTVAAFVSRGAARADAVPHEVGPHEAGPHEVGTSYAALSSRLVAAGCRAVPVRVHGQAFGALYLTPHDTPPDDELVALLGTLAGSALESAVLNEDAQHSRNWLHASGEIARALLADRDEDILLTMVSRALHVADADRASLILSTEGGRLQIVVATGESAGDVEGQIIDPDVSALGRAVVRGESLLAPDLGALAQPGAQAPVDRRPVMVAPLVDARGVRGAISLVRSPGRAPFNARDLDLVTIFADQVALAMEMADVRAYREQLRVLQDRHRLARDLHDNVMQRLFATGVGLQSLASSQIGADVAVRIGRYVADLDETIDEIRDRIFGLRDHPPGPAPESPGRFLRLHAARRDAEPGPQPGPEPGPQPGPGPDTG